MITRIVRMEFEAEKVEDFLSLFRASMHQIRNFPGVERLELHRDAGKPNVFYTVSEWRSEDDLEAYRHSELFGTVWGQTKVLFSAKPLAYSLKNEIRVES